MLYRIFGIVLIQLLVLSTALADEDTVYKTVDKDGKVTYTDDPPKNQKSEKIDLKGINTMPSVQNRGSSYSETQSPQQTLNYTIRIISPADNYQMGPAEKSIDIVVESNQPLEQGHQFQLMVNGQPFGSKSETGILTLSQIQRGRKQISAIIIDQDGQTLATTAPITVYVLRPNPKI